MAYAFVQAGANNQLAGGTITAGSITVSAGNSLIVWIVTQNSGSQTVSGNGNTYTFVGSSPNTSNFFLSAYFCQNINAGATAVATSDTGAWAIYAAEYSGLATSGGSLGSAFANVANPGTGANAVTTGATASIAANAAAFALAVEIGGLQSASPDTGTISAGTTLAWTSRSSTWANNAIANARTEDIRVTVSAAVTATFTIGGNKGFDTFIQGVFALSEFVTVVVPVPSRGPMPKQIYIMP